MAKIAIKNGNYTSFGGIFHVMEEFSRLGLVELIDPVLGIRGKTGGELISTVL